MNEDPYNNTIYGKLYNWYAVTDSRNLCPADWHIPTYEEWATLENYLGGKTVAGGKLKNTTGWQSPNTAATNSSGFSGLPGGYMPPSGGYLNSGFNGVWWSSTEVSTTSAYSESLGYSSGNTDLSSGSKRLGSSVRCLMD